MPIRVTIDHFNRVVVGVGEGVLTIQDLVTYGLEILKAKVVHYGKIIDVAACEPGFTVIELTAFVEIVREQGAGHPRGPLALVIDPQRGEMARLFAGFDVDGRPANTFRSLREARKWIARFQAEELAASTSRPRPGR
jgi:hypothetical protein